MKYYEPLVHCKILVGLTVKPAADLLGERVLTNFEEFCLLGYNGM
jgi:hypothetical protein